MKTALFVILITESVLKDINTMGIPSNATETIPEDIVDSEMNSTYVLATAKTVNDSTDPETGFTTYATTTSLTTAINNERETTSATDIITEEVTNTSGTRVSTDATEKITQNVTNVSELRLSTTAMETNEPIDNVPRKWEWLGISSAPPKLRKGKVQKKIRASKKATKTITPVKIGRSKAKAMQTKIKKQARKEKANSYAKFLAEDEFDSIHVSLDPAHQESAHLKKNIGKLEIPKPEKPALRYGFQQTKHCQDYDKAFMCIRKCLDMGYDLANADKNCVCTCRRNRMLHMHKQLIKMHSSTPWKGGAPTTSLPPWVMKQISVLPKPVKNPENVEDELYADVSYSHKSGEGVAAGAGGDAGEDAKDGEEEKTKGDGDGAGDGEGDGEAKGEGDENATPAEGEAGEGGEGGKGGEGGEGAEGAEGGEGGERGEEAAPAEEGEAAPAEEGEAAPAEEGEAAPAEEGEAPAEER